MIGALSSRILLYVGGAYLLAVAGLWAAIGVLALFGEGISDDLQLAAAVVTGVGALALLPLGLGLSRMLWELDRKRVWRSLGDLAAVGMLALVLTAAGFVLVDALGLLGGAQDNDGVPDGNLVAIMVFVGGFGLLAIVLVVRRSPPPLPEEIALSDILGHAELARKAADQADASLRQLDKAIEKKPKDHGAAITAARGTAECVRITARCAGLTLDQLMRTSVDPRFGEIVNVLGRRSRAGLAAHGTGLRETNKRDAQLADLRKELRPLETKLAEAEGRAEAAAGAKTEAELTLRNAVERRNIAQQNLRDKQAALETAKRTNAPKDEIDKMTAEKEKAERENEEVAREAGKAEADAKILREYADQARDKVVPLEAALEPSKAREHELLSKLRKAATKCATQAKTVADTVEWAADEAYATVETGEPAESKAPKEEKKPESAPAAGTTAGSGGSGP